VTTDAILFSVNPSLADVDDAIAHLEEHKELYWSVRFRISKDKFLFPIFGFMHISGTGQVEHRALIRNIVPFTPEVYENPKLKPEPWRQSWEWNRDNVRSAPWKNTLVMTEIVPFSLETKRFRRIDGGWITNPPQQYARVSVPNEEGAPLSSPISIAEKNLEDIVIHQLDEIEEGLKLHERQLSTPAGRLAGC
jgi:hypothetical protein